MFVPISNTPRPYAWGARTALAELLGREPSGEPEAELWLGAHPGSPARLDATDAEGRPSPVTGFAHLAEWIAVEPERALGAGAGAGADADAAPARLPFLLKVLAADSALSLQAHPSPREAVEGFARENAAGIPLDAPHRNYRDASAKPEVVVALRDGFEALCGFRDLAHSQRIVDALLALEQGGDPHADDSHADGLPALTAFRAHLSSIAEAFAWLTRGEGEVPELVEVVTAIARRAGGAERSVGSQLDDEVASALRVVMQLADEHPGDPGIVCSILLNHVVLARGEALFLPAGNIHAYLRGVAVEIMSSSDNVLRGGLTPKHVDVAELVRVLDFSSVPVPYLVPERHEREARADFRPGVDDFVLARVTGEATFALTGPAIALSLEGEFAIEGELSRTRLTRGTATFITPEERMLRFAGEGELFLATTP